MNRLSSFFRLPSPALLAAVAAMVAGCTAPYVDPAETNPGSRGSFTRSETLSAEQRLVNALLADPIFAQHYASKVAQKGGAAPAVQVASFKNGTGERVQRKLDAVREDVANALRSSGRFVLSGDPDACDYVLKGEYRDIPDGKRVSHRLALSLHDTAADLDVWTGSDEIAKE